jgi:hypothetical protein
VSGGFIAVTSASGTPASDAYIGRVPRDTFLVTRLPPAQRLFNAKWGIVGGPVLSAQKLIDLKDGVMRQRYVDAPVEEGYVDEAPTTSRVVERAAWSPAQIIGLAEESC